MTHYYSHTEVAAAKLISDLGKTIVIGVPLGLGKPVGLLNALYRLAAADASLQLTILTGLTLARPEFSQELEKNLVAPILERILGDYEDLLYEKARDKQALPHNIRVIEFFLSPGKYLHNAYAQQNYISSTYANAARDIQSYGVNVIAQMVAHSDQDANLYSLSCNSDLFHEAVKEMRQSGRKMAVVAEVNLNLPFMFGDAVLPAETFTDILDTGQYRQLFALPHDELALSDHMIGLYTSALIKDDGCLQIGIGKLSTAVANALTVREKHNALYVGLLEKLNVKAKFPSVVEIGGVDTFEKGLYGSTEMLSDDYLALYDNGILKKRTYDHVVLQQLLNQGKITEQVSWGMIDVLLECELISSPLSASNVEFLQHFGILKPEVYYESGTLILNSTTRVPADLSLSESRDTILRYGLGDKLQQGKFLHAAFFLGTNALYRQLRELDTNVLKQIDMTTVFRTNTLEWNPELLALQRQHMRFVNSAMMITLGGVVISDGLKNLQEVSGVGGQFDFIYMSQKLPGSRSIINCRSMRQTHKGWESNIIWDYENFTIPRFLRDLVVTEYGIADCRSQMDAEIIKRILQITDSRVQEKLLAQAKRYGKVEQGYEIPAMYRQNYPEVVKKLMEGTEEYFKPFPFGTELTEEEIVLSHALLFLKYCSGWKLLGLFVKGLFIGKQKFKKYLERMGVWSGGIKAFFYRNLLAAVIM